MPLSRHEQNYAEITFNCDQGYVGCKLTKCQM